MDEPGRAAPPPRRGSSDRSRNRPRPRRRTLDELRPWVREGRYRLGRHAARHAVSEGFTERDVVATLMHGRELMRYLEDERLLVLGWVPAGPRVRLPLHVVVEFSRPRWVDVVTAFIPEDPHRVVSRRRLAEALRWDREDPERSSRGG